MAIGHLCCKDQFIFETASEHHAGPSNIKTVIVPKGIHPSTNSVRIVKRNTIKHILAVNDYRNSAPTMYSSLRGLY